MSRETCLGCPIEECHVEVDGLCNRCDDIEDWLAEHDKQIRDEVIDNFVKIVNAHIRDEMVLGESVKWMIEDFAEQIKGEQNE